jgi:DNA-binding transcriptional ArsR family regulator
MTDAVKRPEPQPRTITDVNAMRALAHPERLAILLYLLAGSPRTATECSAEVGASPSACSYHLRELERFGFVERAESVGDQRARPWRATSVGFSLGGDWAEDSPAGRAARHALGRAELAENLRLVERFLGAVDALDPAWQSASDFHNFELLVTPEELVELNGAVATLLRRYRASTRRKVPKGAARVHVTYQAFPRVGPP